MNNFVKAESGIGSSAIYTDASGEYCKYSGGTRAWRYHNPGNLRPGPGHIGEKHGQIGVIDKYCVFPDDASGHAALLDVLTHTYANSSIDEMMAHFAPPKENRTIAYIKYLHKYTGVLDDKKIKDFSAEEFEKLWRGIERYEGYKEGQITRIYKVSHVHREAHTGIADYHVDQQGWLSKQICISLAMNQQLELEVCKLRSGSTYLRSAPHSTFQSNLSSLVVRKRK